MQEEFIENESEKLDKHQAQSVPKDNKTDQDQPILISRDMLAEDKKIDSRIDFEKGISYCPPLTLTLIFANVIVFLWEISTGALESQEAIIAAGALYRERVLDGEIARLISAMFLHGGVDHLLANCIMLYILGMACEHALGFRQVANVYLLSGLSGAILSLLMHPGPSVGASGAIFGIMASVILFLYRYQRLFFVRDKRIGFVLLIYTLYQIAGGFFTPYIDNFGHIGGLIGGGVVTLFMKPKLLTSRKEKEKPL